MVCQYLEDFFELYLLGVSSAEEANTVAEHLATGCPHCLAHLREAVLTVYLVSQPSKLGRIEPRWKTSLLRRLRKG
jgi:Fe-S oxidoreductase